MGTRCCYCNFVSLPVPEEMQDQYNVMKKSMCMGGCKLVARSLCVCTVIHKLCVPSLLSLKWSDKP